MSTTTDWHKIRKAYAVTQGQVYLMNAAVSGMHERTVLRAQEMLNLISQKAATADEVYFSLIQTAKKTVSEFINCQESEMAFTPNTSHNMNILAMLLLQHTSKRKIIACADEFPSSLVGWYHHGFNVELIRSNNHVFGAQDFLEKIDSDTAAIVLSHIQYGSGYKMPIAEVVKTAKEKSIPVFVNATQSMGQIKVDVKELGIDALSASCHKWVGAGIGLSTLFISDKFSKNKKWPLAGWVSVDEPWLLSVERPNIRKDAGVLGTGSTPFINLASIQEAIKVIHEIGIDKIRERILYLSEILYKGLIEIGAHVFSPRDNDNQKSGILSFELKTKSAEEIALKLKDQKIFINHRKGRCRASVHFYNNEEDIHLLLTGLRSL